MAEPLTTAFVVLIVITVAYGWFGAFKSVIQVYKLRRKQREQRELRMAMARAPAEPEHMGATGGFAPPPPPPGRLSAQSTNDQIIHHAAHCLGEFMGHVNDQIMVVVSDKEPPTTAHQSPWSATAISVWVRTFPAAEHSHAALYTDGEGGTWQEVGDHRYGIIRHVLLEAHDDTLVTVQAVSTPGIKQFAQRVEALGKHAGGFPVSELPTDMLKWLDEQHEQRRSLIVNMLSLDDSARGVTQTPLQPVAKRRAVDLD